MRVSVLVPAYNEERTVEEILRRVLAQEAVAEVIVVDDASSDGTAAAVERMAAQDPRVRLIRHERNRGKGAAVRTGLAQASGDVVIIQDADLEYNPADYAVLLFPIERGEADFVLGSRYLAGADTRRLFGLGNRLITWWFNLLYGTRLSDVLTCYKAFRRELVNAGELCCEGFDIDVELPAKLLRHGARVAETPISYDARGAAEGKKIRWWVGFRLAWATLRFRFG
ncbi:MAG: glycosyltransferase family 2 protein [Armatimonadetes bacterium]|nr:glycosyltransferase family 2 protein [Armatimonadota bacterium]